MTKEEVAARMDGREYGSEMLDGEEKELHDARLVALFGYSDDVVEVRGASYDELGTDVAYFTSDGLLSNRCVNERCPYHRDEALGAASVKPKDGGDEYGLWDWETTIPFARFLIMEDGEVYGSGIVFSLDELGA